LNATFVNKKQQIKQLKEELQHAINENNEAHVAITQHHVIHDISMQTLVNEVKQLQDVLEKNKGIEPYYLHKLRAFDELQMNYTILKTKMKATKLKETNINKWWDLVQDMVDEEKNNTFNQHHTNEDLYKTTFKVYQQYHYITPLESPKSKKQNPNYEDPIIGPGGEVSKSN
jgi:hypothetical protein